MADAGAAEGPALRLVKVERGLPLQEAVEGAADLEITVDGSHELRLADAVHQLVEYRKRYGETPSQTLRRR